MKKQCLLICLSLGLIISNITSASPFSNHMIDKIKQTKINDSKSKTANDSYPDFSATWVGKCDFEDSDNEMVIEQDPSNSYIVIDNKQFAIDEITTQGFTSNHNTYNDIMHFHWNNDGQELISSVLNYYYEDNLSRESLNVGIRNLRLFMQNDQLIIKVTSSAFTDGIGNYIEQPYNCVYKKKLL